MEWTDDKISKFLTLSGDQECIEDRLHRLAHVYWEMGQAHNKAVILEAEIKQEITDKADELKDTKAEVFLKILEAADKKPSDSVMEASVANNPQVKKLRDAAKNLEVDLLNAQNVKYALANTLKALDIFKETLRECSRGLSAERWSQ